METLAPYLWWLGLFANEMIIEMDTIYTHTHTQASVACLIDGYMFVTLCSVF